MKKILVFILIISCLSIVSASDYTSYTKVNGEDYSLEGENKWGILTYSDMEVLTSPIQQLKIDDEEQNIDATNVKLKVDYENKVLTIIPQGEDSKISINGHEFSVKYVKDSQFVVNNKGELIAGTKFTTNQGKFRIKGYDVDLPEDVEVEYEEDKIVLKVPKGAKISEPVKVDMEAEDQVFSYQSEGAIELEGNLVEIEGGTEINYDKGFYFTDKNAVIKYNEKEDVLINNKNSEKVYLFFDENKIDESKSSIFLGDDKVILTSLKSKGASVFFTKDNRLGIRVDADHTAAAQAVNGKVIVEKVPKWKLPNFKISGNSLVNLDKKVFSVRNGELYLDSEGLIAGFDHGKYDAMAKLTLVDNNGNRLNNFDVYSNGKGQYASVDVGKFESSLEFFKAPGDFYVSNTVAFNLLNPNAQKFYDKLNSEQQKQLVVASKGNFLTFQSGIEQLIMEEKRRRQNPYYASARLASKGFRGRVARGSATIVGIDEKGHPIAVTAGHVVRTPGKSVTLTLKTEDGKKKTYTGKVLGGTSYPDVAVIKVDQVDFDAPYTPVGSMKDIKVGAIGLRMGYPASKGRAFEAVRARITEVLGTDNRVWTFERVGPLPGSSGGGFFLDGRLNGITSRARGWRTGTGGYTSPDDVRAELSKYGYGHMIILIFVN